MNSEWFTTDQVRQLVDLLTVIAAAPDTSDEHRYELDYCRSQLAPQMPAVEVLVLTGVLHETTDRPAASGGRRITMRLYGAYSNDAVLSYSAGIWLTCRRPY